MTLELGIADSPNFNQPELEVLLIAGCVTAFVPFTNLKNYHLKLYYIIEKELPFLPVPSYAL